MVQGPVLILMVGDKCVNIGLLRQVGKSVQRNNLLVLGRCIARDPNPAVKAGRVLDTIVVDLEDGGHRARCMPRSDVEVERDVPEREDISLFDDLRLQQKDIVSFTSFCGGLPAPENAEGVPLKYKFSWSPKGVLSAALNGARFKLWDQVSHR